MKKLIAILLAALMLVTMVACDDGNKPASDDSVPTTLKKEDMYGTWSLRMDLSAAMGQSFSESMESFTVMFGDDFMDSLASEMEAIFVFDEEGTKSGFKKEDLETFYSSIINGMVKSIKNGGALKILAQSMDMTEAEARAYLEDNGMTIDSFAETLQQQMPTVESMVESSGLAEKDGYYFGDKSPYEVNDDSITCDVFKMTYAIEDGKIIIKSYGEGELMVDVNCELVRVK